MKQVNSNNPLRKRKKERLLILLIITTLFICSGWQIFESTVFSKISNLYIEHQHLLSEKEHLLNLLTDEKQTTAERSDIEAEFTRLTGLFQPYSALPSVLSSLDQLLSVYSDSKKALRLTDSVFEEEYISLTIFLEAEAHPNELQTLISDLERFPHLLLIDYLHWSTLDGSQNSLDLELRLIFLEDY